jgi:hypothetical protein
MRLSRSRHRTATGSLQTNGRWGNFSAPHVNQRRPANIFGWSGVVSFTVLRWNGDAELFGEPASKPESIMFIILAAVRLALECHDLIMIGVFADCEQPGLNAPFLYGFRAFLRIRQVTLSNKCSPDTAGLDGSRVWCGRDCCGDRYRHHNAGRLRDRQACIASRQVEYSFLVPPRSDQVRLHHNPRTSCGAQQWYWCGCFGSLRSKQVFSNRFAFCLGQLPSLLAL